MVEGATFRFDAAPPPSNEVTSGRLYASSAPEASGVERMSTAQAADSQSKESDYSQIAKAGETVTAHRGERVKAEANSTVTAEAGSFTFAIAGSTVNADKNSHVLAEKGAHINEQPGADVTWQHKTKGGRYQSKDDLPGGPVDKFIFEPTDATRQETSVEVLDRDRGGIGYIGSQGQVVSMKTSDGSSWDKLSATAYPGAAADGLWTRVAKDGSISNVALGEVNVTPSGIKASGSGSAELLRVLQLDK